MKLITSLTSFTWRLQKMSDLNVWPKSKSEQLASRIRLLSAFSTGGLGILKNPLNIEILGLINSMQPDS